MVAETVQAPVTETKPTGDTGAPAADAAESSTVAEYFEAQSKGSAVETAPESGGEIAPPVEDEFPALTEARQAAAAATEERVTRETQARIEREAKARELATAATEEGRRFRENYANRVNTTRDEVYSELTRAGYDHETALQSANRIAGRINEHHADGLKLYEPVAMETANAAFVQNFNTSAREALTADEAREFFGTTDKPTAYSLPEAITALKAIATKGMVSEKEAKAQAKLEVLKYEKWLEDKGLLKGTTSKSNGLTGTPTGSGNEPKDWKEVELMGAGMHPSGRKLTTAEVRGYAAQFGVRVPTR